MSLMKELKEINDGKEMLKLNERMNDLKEKVDRLE